MKYCVIIFVSLLIKTGYAQVDSSTSSDDFNGNSDENTESPYYSVKPGDVSLKKGYNTEQIEVQRFDQVTWKKIVGSENYSEETLSSNKKESNTDSAFSNTSHGSKRLDRDEDHTSQEDNNSSSIPIESPILTMIVYTFAIGIIVYILFLILKNISLKSNGKIIKTDTADPSAPIEDIRELEIEKLLREVMASGNYRLAIRIYFLGLLKKLDENNFITWKKDKTNRDYLSELFSKGHFFEEIKGLTSAYEQVWYGDHNFPVATYEQIITSFKTVEQKLNVSKTSEKGS